MAVSFVGHFNENTSVEAAGPRPTNVNMTINSDASVNGYYSSVAGKSGDELLGALHNIIKGHHEYDFDSTTDRYIYKIIDRNWDLSPLTSAQLSNFNYTTDNPYIRKLYADYNNDINTADRFRNDGADRVSFDKEHIWAQSLGNFGRTGGAGSDFHALWPSDTKGNQQAHSNYNFGIPTSGIVEYLSDKDTYVGRNGNIPGGQNKVFEPLDQYKGDIARAMFYMPARYYVYEDTLHPKLTLVNGSPAAVTASPSQPGLAGNLQTLLEWNKLDPVDEMEILRNNLLHNNYQGNRNPFIDHPEWADIAYDTSYTGSGATVAAGTSSVGDNPAWQTPDKLLTSISLDTTSAITSFEVGDGFDIGGLIVTANYDDFSSKVVSSYHTSISVGYVFEETGSQIITISYSEFEVTKTATYTINVVPATKFLTHISLNLAQTKQSFTFKETFDYSGLIVTAHYDNNTQAVINNFSISTPAMDKLGSQDVTISYRGQEQQYSITITNNNADFGSVFANDLIFSEYIEGSSNNKAIEIYNGTGSTVSLSGYSVKLYANGNTIPISTLNLSGSVDHGRVFVISNSSANSAIQEKSNMNSGVANFNGNDALELLKNNAVIDRFGQVEVDPGTAWTSGGVTTLDRTLVRKHTITSGDPNSTAPFNPSLEWVQYPIDTFSYLGSHTMFKIVTSSDATEQAVAYANLFLEVTSPYCVPLNGGSVNWSYLSNEYGYMVSLSKDQFYDNTTDDDILAAKERYEYLIKKYANLATNNFIKNSNNNVLISLSAATTSGLSKNDSQNILFALMIIMLTISSYAFIHVRKHRNTL